MAGFRDLGFARVDTDRERRQGAPEAILAEGTAPDWDAAGATFPDHITPFEHRRLRLLDGVHSRLAYAGSIRDHTTVARMHDRLDPITADGSQKLPIHIVPVPRVPAVLDPALASDAVVVAAVIAESERLGAR